MRGAGFFLGCCVSLAAPTLSYSCSPEGCMICPFLSRPGRKRGKMIMTRLARENCTSMCIDVVNSGKWKSKFSDENIHLL